MKKQLIAFTILTSFMAVNTYPAAPTYLLYPEFAEYYELVQIRNNFEAWAKNHNKENDPEIKKQLQQLDKEIEQLQQKKLAHIDESSQ